jgi:hypothetical protein
MALHFNRTVSSALLTEIRPGGSFEGLVSRCAQLPELADVQLRRAQEAACHASLYIGLTSVLNLQERAGLFALSAHKTHREQGGFDPRWSTFREPAALSDDWPAVEEYLDRLLVEGGIDPRWYRREGIVHTLLCSGRSNLYGAIQREAVPWADGPPSVRDIVSELADHIWTAAVDSGRKDPWWPGVRDRGSRKAMGDELDVLSIDLQGRLLCMEAKPAPETAGIVWSVAQVLVYADLFARWIDQDPGAAALSLSEMAAQRAAIRLLSPTWADRISPDMRVVPVVPIGPGVRSPVALERLAELSRVLELVPRHPLVDPTEIWLLDESGDPTDVWLPHEGPPPTGRGSKMASAVLLGQPHPRVLSGSSNADPGDDLLDDPAIEDSPSLPIAPVSFVAVARAASADWMSATDLVPDEAKVGAQYGGKGPIRDFVLPSAYQWQNLLPEARDVARTRFSAAAIHWHGDDDGPNPNLLSSQIQCLNALAPLVDRPEDLARWFGSVLPIDQVIPFGAETESPYDATDHVVFEWQGLHDHLNEWHGKGPTRGAMATSIDAAFRYLTPGGSVEMALVEWKYTENYPYGGRLEGSAQRHQHRLDRYRDFASDPNCPVSFDRGVDYEDLLAEPTYQLFRQQLLAWQIEKLREQDVDRAVVVYAAPSRNTALLRDSLGTHRFRQLAAPLGGLVQGWESMLRRSDRFTYIDTAPLAAAGSICTNGFRQRYAHLLESA